MEPCEIWAYVMTQNSNAGESYLQKSVRDFCLFVISEVEHLSRLVELWCRHRMITLCIIKLTTVISCSSSSAVLWELLPPRKRYTNIYVSVAARFTAIYEESFMCCVLHRWSDHFTYSYRREQKIQSRNAKSACLRYEMHSCVPSSRLILQLMFFILLEIHVILFFVLLWQFYESQLLETIHFYHCGLNSLKMPVSK